MAVQSQIQKNEVDTTEYSPTIIDVDCVKESLERSCILYDKKGEEHYNCASALQKSIRGSDPDAALYWMARMLEGGEDPLFIARRLVRTASEDIGLADPLALTQAVAAFQATNFIGKPECDVILAQCAVYLARAPKSVEVYSAYTKAKQCILEHRGPLPSVPLHLRNATTGLMKSLEISALWFFSKIFERLFSLELHRSRRQGFQLIRSTEQPPREINAHVAEYFTETCTLNVVIAEIRLEFYDNWTKEDWMEKLNSTQHDLLEI
eukprot:XP_014775292.1 PREDICTED: ATPase WRNIP1-like [Octopus bimaculoides]